MRITVKNSFVEEKRWEKNGRSGVIRTQEAMAECDQFRQTVRLDLGKNDPFVPGEYNLDLQRNLVVNQFGDFQLARNLKLERIEQKPALAKTA